MSFGTTYTDLKAQLQAWLEEDGTEFTGSIDDVIGLGEIRLLRDLDLTIFDTFATALSATAGSQFVTKPTGWVMTRELYFDNGSGKLIEMEERDTSYLRTYWPTATAYGTPKYWAEYSTGSWQIAPTPSSALTFHSHHHERPAGLSTTNESTFLSNACPDLLHYACLLESEKFLVGDERIPTWLTTYGDRLAGSKNELRRLARDDYQPTDVAAQATDQD